MAAFQHWQAVKCFLTVLIPEAEHGYGHQDLIRVEARIVSVKIGHLGLLDRLDHVLGNELKRMGNPCQVLGSVEYERSARPEERTGLRTDYRSVLEFDRG